VELLRIYPPDADVTATLPIVQHEDSRVAKFPINRLARRIARREHLSTKI
jgi:hypothetical protein